MASENDDFLLKKRGRISNEKIHRCLGNINNASINVPFKYFCYGEYD